MKYLGATLLSFGILILVSSYPGVSNPILPFWTAGIGGFLIVASYFLSWRE